MNMDHTGERMMPEESDLNTFWEHLFRYAFVCNRVKEMRVLDIASGEGYGTAALSKVARNVVGVDISSEAVEYATSKYGLDFRVGCAESIPIESESLDAVVSFETIEHVPDPSRFVKEVSRVLVSGGLFYVSTPNADIYLKDSKPNPFHCSEMTVDELKCLLSEEFEISEIYGQVFQRSRFDDLQNIVGNFSCSLAYHFRRKLERAFNKLLLSRLSSTEIGMRSKMIERLGSFDPFFSRPWNPYILRRSGTLKFGHPTYIIAIAKKR